jgi:hypothetical protein
LDIKVNAAWFLVSQESLTKKLLSKYKSGRYWDNMIKRILALTIVLTLMISFLPSIFLTELASANPLNFPIPSMKIVSPPDPPNRKTAQSP